MIKVLLLSDLSRDPDRQLIRGISKYAKGRAGWIFYQVSSFLRDTPEHQDEILARARDLKVDVIFGAWPGLDPTRLPELEIPIVLKQGGLEPFGISSSHCNHAAVGKLAAEFLTGLGRETIAFSGFDGASWSDDRYAGFVSAMGRPVTSRLVIRDRQSDWDRIVSWLEGLPKPASIFCCNDNNARSLMEICQSVGIRIPEDVAILGVDNDEFVCDLTSPSLSTIKLDYEAFGYRVGQMIHRAVTSGDRRPFTIVHEPLGIIERDSTPPSRIRDPYVEKVMSYMREHFADGCRIADAVASVPLSRRSVEIRFRKEFGNVSMLQYLTGLRLEKIEELIVSTKMPFQDIVVASGFAENENVYRLFRRHFGCTPLEYRRVHRKV